MKIISNNINIKKMAQLLQRLYYNDKNQKGGKHFGKEKIFKRNAS